MSESVSKLLREIPSVSELLESGPIRDLVREFGDGATKLELRALLEERRTEIRIGRRGEAVDSGALASALRRRCASA